MASSVPKIAVVDDDRPVLKALARLLRGRGFAADTFESGKDFLKALKEGIPDCLLLDLQMPDMSGFDLYRRLDLDGMTIPTIAITGNCDDELRSRCHSAGLHVVLSKPLQASELFGAIEEAIGQRGL